MGEIFSTLAAVEKNSIFHSVVIIFMHLTFLLYLINQRLQLFAYAIHKDTECLAERNTTWGRRIVCVSISGTLEIRDTSESRLQDYYNTLQTIYSSIESAFVGTIMFYSTFLCLSLVITVSLTSINILFLIIIKGDSFLSLFLAFIFLLQIVPILLCLRIISMLQAIRTLMRSIYITRTFKTINRRNEHDYIENNTYDCGYFDIDSKLFLTIFNFISLFVLTMLEK